MLLMLERKDTPNVFLMARQMTTNDLNSVLSEKAEIIT